MRLPRDSHKAVACGAKSFTRAVQVHVSHGRHHHPFWYRHPVSGLMAAFDMLQQRRKRFGASWPIAIAELTAWHRGTGPPQLPTGRYQHSRNSKSSWGVDHAQSVESGEVA